MQAVFIAGVMQLGHTYTHKVGYLAGSALMPKLTANNITLAQAEAVCSNEPSCRGFCFASDIAAPVQIDTVFFMNQSTVGYTAFYQVRGHARPQ